MTLDPDTIAADVAAFLRAVQGTIGIRRFNSVWRARVCLEGVEVIAVIATTPSEAIARAVARVYASLPCA